MSLNILSTISAVFGTAQESAEWAHDAIKQGRANSKLQSDIDQSDLKLKLLEQKRKLYDKAKDIQPLTEEEEQVLTSALSANPFATRS